MASADGGIQVISRAAKVLRQLKLDNGGQSLGSIASQTGLPRSTVQRIVNALIAEGFVASSGQDGGLRLGAEIQSLAAAGRVDVVSAMRPTLEKLSESIGETVDLAIFRQSHMTFVDQVPGCHRLRAVSVPGEDFPLVSTANGKAALALLRDEQIVQICQGKLPKSAINSFLEEILRVRTRGLAFDLDEHTVGISAAGMAFQTMDGEIYAVSIPAPSRRFAEKRVLIEQALLELAAATLLQVARPARQPVTL